MTSKEKELDEMTTDVLAEKVNRMQQTLQAFGIKVKDVKWVRASSYELYKIYLPPGSQVCTIKNLEADIEQRIGASIRIVTMSDCVGIEVPIMDRKPYLLLDSIKEEPYYSKQKFSLPIILGEGLWLLPRVVDLADLPHLLVAGATKQGKTVFLRNLIMSLIWKKNPEDLKFVLIDPKGIELTPFETLKNTYLATLPKSNSEEKEACIATDISRAETMLSALCLELEKRYELLSSAGVRDIKSYNKKLKDSHLPYIVCICDEYADLIMGTDKALKKSIQASIIRLAQKGRAVGIHMVISTQRPCTDVITGIIKANFPARAAFRVASRVDSTVILDDPGAEKLSGNGDMLFSMGLDYERIQVPFYPKEEMEEEILKEVEDLKVETPYFLPTVMDLNNKSR